MGQEISHAVDRIRACAGAPAVSLEAVLARAQNPAAVASRYHPRGSGRCLEDDYDTHGDVVLGEGSTTRVVLVHGKVVRQKYALKTLGKRDEPLEALERAVREVEILLTLDHPNVVKLFDVYEARDARVHLVMECCSGGELFYRMVEKGSFAEPEAARALGQMLRSVGYLHARGIVHRDLKPENFLYENKGDEAVLKLIDFGFGKVWDPLKLMKRCCGSLLYVSPEVLEQQGYTNKCDIWSLGVIAYMMLMGRPPFQGNAGDVKRKIKAGVVEYFEQKMGKWSALSKEAADFIKCLLVKDPEERMSAREAIFHPWLLREDSSSVTSSPTCSPEVVRSLEGYASMPPLQRAMVQLVAQHLSPEETHELRKLFLNLDTEIMGYVTVQNLMGTVQRCCRRETHSAVAAQQLQSPRFFVWMSRAPPPSAEAPTPGTDAVLSEFGIRALSNLLTSIWGESVCYSEFLGAVAGTALESRSGQRALNTTFRKLDADLSGSISASDIEKAFGGIFDAEAAEDWLAAVAGGGELDSEGFARALRGAYRQSEV